MAREGSRLGHLRRIFKVYLTRDKGYLSFWHEHPAVSGGIKNDSIGPYYQTFEDKAKYTGPRDQNGVILFDYYFDIGQQYNPLAIAQYGLGNFNLYLKTREEKYLSEAKLQAEWLIKNLEENDKGFWVWKHRFPWHYKKWLKSGWFSAHSQGTGISLLVRLYKETSDKRCLETAQKAFVSLDAEIKNGGVKYIDPESGVWLEEYLISPPTHILNGYLWALWGVWDYWLLTKDENAKRLFDDCVKTIKKNINLYDCGFWSLYDLSQQALKMVASHYYHGLHIVQLKATAIISGEKIFGDYALKFEKYRNNFLYRQLSLIYKAVFKILYF